MTIAKDSTEVQSKVLLPLILFVIVFLEYQICLFNYMVWSMALWNSQRQAV